MRVLITGGLGFVGSHTCVELAKEGNRLVVVDNLANAKLAVLGRIRELAPGAGIEFVRAILPSRTRTPPSRHASLAGARSSASMRCAGTRGAGNRRTRPGIRTEEGSVSALATG